MVELSKARARPSPVRRSSGRVPDLAAQGPSVKTQTFARDVSGAGAGDFAATSLFSNLAKGLSAFIPGAAQADKNEHIDRMHKIEKDNIELARLANTNALSRPVALRRALETGDLEGFEDLPKDAFQRRAFLDTANQNLAVQSANQIATSPDWVSKLTDSNSPDATVADMIQEETKGMNPVAAEAFAAQFKTATARLVGQRKLMMTQESVTADLAVLSQNTRANPPTTLEEHDQVVGNARAISSRLGAQAEMDAQADFDLNLIHEAIIEKQPWAMRLIDERREGQNDNLSIRERYHEEVEQMKIDAINQVGGIQSPESREHLQDIKVALGNNNIGAAQQLLSDHQETYGDRENMFIALKDAFNRATAGAVGRAALLLAIDENDWDAISDKDKKKNDEELIKIWPGLMAERGFSEEEAVIKLADMLESYTPSGAGKNAMAQKLKQLDPFTLQVLSAMGASATNILPSAYKGLWESISRADNKGEALRKWQERQDDPPGYVQSNVLEKLHGMTNGANKRALYVEAVELAIGLSGVAGTDTFLGIDFFGLNDPDVNIDGDEVSLRVVPEMEQILRNVMMDHPDESRADQLDIAAKRMAPRLSSEMIDGDLRVTVSKVGLRGVSNIDVEYVRQGNEWMQDEFRGISTSVGASPRGPARSRGNLAGTPSALDGAEPIEFADTMKVDELTSRGYGLSPEFNGPLGRNSMAYEIGSIETMSAEQAASPLFAMWRIPAKAGPGVPDFRPANTPDGFVLRVAPDTDISFGDRLAWVAVDGEAHLRYVGPDLEADAVVRLNDRNEPMIFSGQQSSNEVDARSRGPRFTARGAKEVQDQLSGQHIDSKARSRMNMRRPTDASEVLANVEQAETDTLTRGEFMLDMTGSERGMRFAAKYEKVLAVNEGANTNYPYDDQVGSSRIPAGAGVRGKRTIGLGYNMDRGDWPEMSSRLGLSTDQAKKVRAGKLDLTDPQKTRLNSILAQKASTDVYNKYKDFEFKFASGNPVQMREHFFIGRMSLFHHGIEDSPLMDAAMNRGDWNAVAEEIVNNSASNFKGGPQEAAIRIRRLREARIMLGPFVMEVDHDLQREILSVNPYRL